MQTCSVVWLYGAFILVEVVGYGNMFCNHLLLTILILILRNMCWARLRFLKFWAYYELAQLGKEVRERQFWRSEARGNGEIVNSNGENMLCFYNECCKVTNTSLHLSASTQRFFKGENCVNILNSIIHYEFIRILALLFVTKKVVWRLTIN